MNEYIFEEIEIGKIEEFSKLITQRDLIIFSNLTGDINPLHMDKEYANSTIFKEKVVFGLLVQSYLSTLAGVYLPGKYSLILSVDSKFRKPAFIGDKITVRGEVKDKINLGNLLILDVLIKNQKHETLINSKMKIKVLK